MKLNLDYVLTITKPEYTVLKSIEFLSRFHEYVPLDTIPKHSNLNSIIYDLTRSKFLRYQSIPFTGYKITTSGYDCLAITSLRKKGLNVMGSKIGIGKECDLFYGEFNKRQVALKFHRIGRTSFRSVKNNRDYHKSHKFVSWNQYSKTSAEREYNYMVDFKHLNIPEVIVYDRHVVVMELLDEYELLNSARDYDLNTVYIEMMQFIETLWNYGYVHGDFNEFNVMLCDNKIKVIDFPQCVKNTHERSDEYLKRDIENVKIFFERRHRYQCEAMPDIIYNK